MPVTIDGTSGISFPDGITQDSGVDSTGTAPLFGVRAWVQFDANRDSTNTASTAATNRWTYGKGNVASVLRNSAGDFTVTFTTAMPDTGYAVIIVPSRASSDTAGFIGNVTEGTISTTSFNFVMRTSNGTAIDRGNISVIVVR